MFPIGPYWSLLAQVATIGNPIGCKCKQANKQSQATWFGGVIRRGWGQGNKQKHIFIFTSIYDEIIRTVFGY